LREDVIAERRLRVQEILASIREDLLAMDPAGLEDDCEKLDEICTITPELSSEVVTAFAEMLELEGCHRMEDSLPLFMSVEFRTWEHPQPAAEERLFQALKGCFMKLSCLASCLTCGELMVELRPDSHVVGVLREAWEKGTGWQPRMIPNALYTLVRDGNAVQETEAEAMRLLEEMVQSQEPEMKWEASLYLEKAKRHLAEREKEG